MFDPGQPTGPDQGTPVKLPAFRLDRFEVTVGRLRAYREVYVDGQTFDDATFPWGPVDHPSGMYAKYAMPSVAELDAALSVPGSTWTAQPGPNEARPAVHVPLVVALDFCRWDGGWLPIEAELEFAMKGGDEQRMFPWGNAEPDGCRARVTTEALPDVGQFPAGQGKWGHADLRGLAQETVPEIEHDASDKLTCGLPALTWFCGISPSAPMPSPTFRGGGGLDEPQVLRSRTRSGGKKAPPAGFRCARPI